MIFVDTNYFLRFLLADNEPQYSKVKRLFLQAARGIVKLATSVVVFLRLLGLFVLPTRKKTKGKWN